MSFILDALRKADARRGGPDTPDVPSLPAEAPVASATVGWPQMAVGGVLLLVAVAAVAWLVGRSVPPGNSPALVATIAPANPVTSAAQASSPTARAAAGVRDPDVRPLDREAAAANAVRAPQSGSASSPGDRTASGAGQIARPTASAGGSTPVTPGRVVYSDEPLDAAVATSRPVTTAATARKTRGPESGLIMYSEFAVNSRSGAPPLRLDIHVYSDDPSSRFVFVNMRKYREGDRVEGDILIDRITPDGAILSLRGQRFLLPRS